MKKLLKFLLKMILFVGLTIITQVGGIAFLLSEFWARRMAWRTWKRGGLFLFAYAVISFVVTPIVAPFFGREKVVHSAKIQPTNYMTVLLNRNYVRPQLNELLKGLEKRLKDTEIPINYLDANFPFMDGFPLLPHLSHSDGKKIDLSLIYETADGRISQKQKSRSGYGVFENPKKGESDQIKKCLKKGYFQYDYPKYLSLGKINRDLNFSEKGTTRLVKAILQQAALGKIFIEPHLKTRLHLASGKIRYHGCRAVRHDDHIHLQLK